MHYFTNNLDGRDTKEGASVRSVEKFYGSSCLPPRSLSSFPGYSLGNKSRVLCRTSPRRWTRPLLLSALVSYKTVTFPILPFLLSYLSLLSILSVPCPVRSNVFPLPRSFLYPFNPLSRPKNPFYCLNQNAGTHIFTCRNLPPSPLCHTPTVLFTYPLVGE